MQAIMAIPLFQYSVLRMMLRNVEKTLFHRFLYKELPIICIRSWRQKIAFVFQDFMLPPNTSNAPFVLFSSFIPLEKWKHDRTKYMHRGLFVRLLLKCLFVSMLPCKTFQPITVRWELPTICIYSWRQIFWFHFPKLDASTQH